MSTKTTEVPNEKKYVTAIQEAGDVLFDFINEQRREDVYREDYRVNHPASLPALRQLKEAHSKYLKTMIDYAIYLERVFNDHQFQSTNPLYAHLIRNGSHLGIEKAFALFHEGICDEKGHPHFCITERIIYEIDHGWIYCVLDGIRIQHAEVRKITHETQKLFGGQKFYQSIERFIRIRDLFISMHMTHEAIDYAIEKILVRNSLGFSGAEKDA